MNINLPLSLLLLFIMTFSYAQDLKSSAKEYAENEQWQSAIKEYKKYLKKYDNDSSAWFELGNSYVKVDAFDLAIESLSNAKLKKYPINTVNLALAKIYAKINKEEQMLNVLNETADNGFPGFNRIQYDLDFAAYKESEGFKKVIEHMYNNAYPCSADEKHRHFDFWLGTWDVYAGDQKVGLNKITKAQGGCAIHEDYTTERVYAGQSINYYDPIDKKWHQHWVGSSGDVYNYLETKQAPGLLQFESKFMQPNGQITLSKLTFTLNPDGTVRQLFESSSDEGITWTEAFNGLYKKVGDN